jgi:hypothetical protein
MVYRSRGASEHHYRWHDKKTREPDCHNGSLSLFKGTKVGLVRSRIRSSPADRNSMASSSSRPAKNRLGHYQRRIRSWGASCCLSTGLLCFGSRSRIALFGREQLEAESWGEYPLCSRPTPPGDISKSHHFRFPNWSEFLEHREHHLGSRNGNVESVKHFWRIKRLDQTTPSSRVVREASRFASSPPQVKLGSFLLLPSSISSNRLS